VTPFKTRFFWRMAISHFAFTLVPLFFGASLWLLPVALLAAGLVAWRRTVAMEHLTLATLAIAQGEFERRVPEQYTPGIKRLADAINQVARTSARRVSTLTSDRNRLATIFAGMVEGVVDVDEKQNIIHINDAAAALFGLDREGSVGKPVWQEIRNQKITLAIDDAIRHRTVIKARIDYPRHNEQLVIDIYVASLSDDQGEPIGAVLVLHDVTELKHLERIRTDFVANASHELKTPITAIRGLAETMVGDPNPDQGTLMQYMERIHSQSLRLSNLITDLMTISRMESDQSTSEFTRINFNDLVRREVKASASAVEAKFHQLTLEPCSDVMEVHGDRQNLSQLCNNLIDNAIKYTPEGGRIVVRLRKEQNEAVLEVEDNGIGISPQYQERVFERFYRVDKARSQSLGGTGLGLSIVRNIAERHQGRVGVSSQLGRGSTFTFRMPIANPLVTEPAPPAP
jgi:two-component system phosphate regulon sensor histidine kinase PhoR